ncbi:unnamed protein product [Acanthosepion pharaonis]|uniref:Uncharacterized protein n=1 Tax=Acanthosepion pharaonis TaxID=158019 RepID=A0A812BV12_ACAPH|nr:unnamed protein product [Sepia pharaonis]
MSTSFIHYKTFGKFSSFIFSFFSFSFLFLLFFSLFLFLFVFICFASTISFFNLFYVLLFFLSFFIPFFPTLISDLHIIIPFSFFFLSPFVCLFVCIFLSFFKLFYIVLFFLLPFASFSSFFFLSFLLLSIYFWLFLSHSLFAPFAAIHFLPIISPTLFLNFSLFPNRPPSFPHSNILAGDLHSICKGFKGHERVNMIALLCAKLLLKTSSFLLPLRHPKGHEIFTCAQTLTHLIYMCIFLRRYTEDSTHNYTQTC